MLEQLGIPEGLQPVERMHAGAGEKCVEEGLAESTDPRLPSPLEG